MPGARFARLLPRFRLFVLGELGEGAGLGFGGWFGYICTHLISGTFDRFHDLDRPYLLVGVVASPPPPLPAVRLEGVVVGAVEAAVAGLEDVLDATERLHSPVRSQLWYIEEKDQNLSSPSKKLVDGEAIERLRQAGGRIGADIHDALTEVRDRAEAALEELRSASSLDALTES